MNQFYNLAFILVSISTISFIIIYTQLPSFISLPPPPTNPPPRLAYFVPNGNGETLKRMLVAIYHPYNVYLLHLDSESSASEHADLADFIASNGVFSSAGNVKIIEKPDMITYKGPTMIANVLHGAAILLREGGDWNWFINLSPYSYPLVTQDDLLYVLSQMPRELNFIDHRHSKMGDEIIIDTGLYMVEKDGFIYNSKTEKRGQPTAFKLFIGSPWVVLTRSFVEYCILGYENLPRTALLYHSNSISSAEAYFHTVICNAYAFKPTAINTDLHFADWWNHPASLLFTTTNTTNKSQNNRNAPFAISHSPWPSDLLDKIDRSYLSRGPGTKVVPGGWCAGWKQRKGLISYYMRGSGDDPCMRVGNVTRFLPGSGAKRLQQFFGQFVRNGSVVSPPQCEVRKLD